MTSWTDGVALVTGASSGIGHAVVEALAAQGVKTVAAARRRDRLDALAERFPEKVHPVTVDLRDDASTLAMFEETRRHWGGVDMMINNAGLGHDSPLMTGDPSKWREMLEVNVLALALCTREAIKDMQKRGIGHVINVASMAAHRVPQGGGMYSATKFAVRALTEGLRQELRQAGSDIRISAISPGYVETEFAEHLHQSAEKARETYARFPVLQPEDVAETVLHILSRPKHMQIHDVLIRSTRQPS